MKRKLENKEEDIPAKRGDSDKRYLIVLHDQLKEMNKKKKQFKIC
jgi:hypothetical protein